MRRTNAPPVIVEVGGRPAVIKLGPDVGGNMEAICTYWRDEFLKAGVVIYILNVPMYLKNHRSLDCSKNPGSRDCEVLREDVRDHLVAMATWHDQRRRRWYNRWFGAGRVPRVLILGTWCDEHPDWNCARPTDGAVYKQLESDRHYIRFRAKLVENGLVPQLLLGSLATPSSRSALIENVVHYMLA